jgi:hypothetical protein
MWEQRFKVEVEDSLGKDSAHEVKALNIAEARAVARNLHILQYGYSNSKGLPSIWTYVQGYDI